MALNIWKGIYRRSVHKKVPFKNTLYLGKYKKDNFLTKRVLSYYFLNTIYNQKFVFLYLLKYNIFFNGTFLHTLLLNISIYVFNVNFFKDIEV
jgi:hypothetical protein